MGGIAGYVGLDPGPAGRTVLRRMARQMVHRGPDGEGLVVHGGVGLAHRRLAVIDGGAQPMRSADGRYLMVYDGEVYNHGELRESLVTAGHTFATDSDAEVVLAAWARWGAGALDRFNGMFALAILDTTTGQVCLARDQFGIKPLYLAADGSGRVGFASEIRPVLAAGVVPRRPDDSTIYRYLRFQVHDDTERTFFDRVSRLLPGQLAVVSPGGHVRRETYTGLRHQLDWLAAGARPYDARARGQVAAGLRAAVGRRLVSDVPVGTVLPGERDGEQRYVDAVAARCGERLEVHKVHPGPDQFLDDLRDFVRTQEEPVLSTGPYAQYCLMREAGRHVRVMLDGPGADEMMAGDPAYLLVQLRQLRRQWRFGAAAVALLRGARPLWRLARGRVADPRRRRRAVAAHHLLGAGFAAAHAGDRFDVVGDDLKRRLADDIFRHRLPARLRYQDRNTMRFSIEGRVPFLDPDLLRLLWGLDDSALIGRGVNQRALRQATARLVPRLVRHRRDPVGSTTAEAAWSARMTGFAHEVFTSDSFGARPYFDQAAVVAAFRSYLAGTGRADTMLFWRLLNVELWLRELVDRDPTVPPASTFTRTHRIPPDGSGQAAHRRISLRRTRSSTSSTSRTRNSAASPR